MMSRILQFFKLNCEALFFGALSGVLIGTSYIPFPPWALFFCYAPLWHFSLGKNRSFTQIFIAGWMAQFVLTLIGFHWIAYVSHEFGFLPWPIAIFLLLIFAAAMHFYIPLTVCGGIYLERKLNLSKGATVLVLAASLALFEQLWPSIFAWNLGYPLLWVNSPFAQWADVIGFEGLSFVIYLLNGWVTWLWLKHNWRLAASTTFAVVLVLGIFYFGGIQKQKAWARGDSELKALMVQANIGNSEKIMAEKGAGFQQFIADEHFHLTEEGLQAHPEADLIFWPESAFPDYVDAHLGHRHYADQLRNFARSIQKPILTGAYSKDPPTKPIPDDYNSVFLLDDKGQEVAKPYHKTQLLVFGEYVPLGEEFPILKKINPGGPGWGRGTGPTVFNFDKAKLGIQICYESLDPFFTSKLVKKGAEILVNVTNDSWFGPHFEPFQHMTMTLARGLEARRPLIRSTNTGITTAILADGTILEQSPLFQKWQALLSVKFQKNPPLTFYSRFGSWLSLVIFVFLLAILGMGRKRDRTVSAGLE